MVMRAFNERLFNHKHASLQDSPPVKPEGTKRTRRLSVLGIRSRNNSTNDSEVNNNNNNNNNQDESTSVLKPNTIIERSTFPNTNINNNQRTRSHTQLHELSSIVSPKQQHPYRLWLSEEMNPNYSKHNPVAPTTSLSTNNNSTANISSLSTEISRNNRLIRSGSSSRFSSKSNPFRSTPALSSMIIDDDDDNKPKPAPTRPSAIAEDGMTHTVMTHTDTFSAENNNHNKRPSSLLLTATNNIPSTADLPTMESSNVANSNKHPTAVKPEPALKPPPSAHIATEAPSAANSNITEPLPRTTQEWKEKGAASAVRTESDSKGRIRTVVIKKGVEDFEFGRTLGNGSYSTVVCGSDKQTLRQYAIKILDKRHIIKEKKVKYVEIEKRTLNRLGDHPGIIPLYYTFQDEDSLYFVLDFAANGELLTLIKKLGSLSEECVRYYGAQLLDAVQFMHSRGVLHRDLKPENILLDDKMRIKVTDFGTAKLLNRERDANGKELDSYPQNVRASSFVGTAEYVSPELLADKYVTKSCDVWAYGCIIYQMIAGRPPFKGSNEYQTFQKIVKLQFSYPPQFPSVIRDLIKHILVLNPDRRYTALQIKQHQFFSGQDWSRSAIWKSPHPRLLPYRPSSRNSPNSVLNIFSGRNSTPNTPSSSNNNNITSSPSHFSRQQQVSSPPPPSSKQSVHPPPNSRAASSPNLISNTSQQHHHPTHASNSNQAVYSAAAGAAAALAKPVSKISPYHTPTQPHTQPPLPANFRPPTQATTSPARPVVPVTRPQPPRIRTSASGPSSGHANVAGLSASTTHQQSPTSVQPSTNPAPPSPKTSQPQQPSPSTSQPPPSPIKPLELPPLSQVDRELKSLRINHDERILKIGSVTMSAANSNHLAGNGNIDATPNSTKGHAQESEDELNNEELNGKEPSRISKLFAGNRKKKRIMFVTTLGRLVVISSIDEPRKLYLDLRVVAPQVGVCELAFNRKTNVGIFTVEAHNKVFTFEDPQGSSDWIAAINKARQYVKNSEAIVASKTHMTAAAAAMAAAASSAMRSGSSGIGKANMVSSGPNSELASGPHSNSAADMRLVMAQASQGRRSSEMDSIVAGTSSLFLRRSEERKLRKGLY